MPQRNQLTVRLLMAAIGGMFVAGVAAIASFVILSALGFAEALVSVLSFIVAVVAGIGVGMVIRKR